MKEGIERLAIRIILVVAAMPALKVLGISRRVDVVWIISQLGVVEGVVLMMPFDGFPVKCRCPFA